MDVCTVKDFKRTHPFAYRVARIDKPHPAIKEEAPIEVYYESKSDSIDGNSRFALFNNDIFVYNTVSFPCEIQEQDISLIANDMISELLSSSDLYDLDLQAAGKCACKEYENIYTSCDECHKLNSVDDGCAGVMYYIPSNITTWMIEKKWSNRYGYGSERYKKATKDELLEVLDKFMSVCGDDVRRIREVLRYVKEKDKHGIVPRVLSSN